MRGKSEEQILEEREKAINLVKEITGCCNITVLDSYFSINKNKHPLYCLGGSLEIMSKANLAYFVQGWENYRGCIVERICAALYGIKILEG